ncbi:uncharacterized protein LOC130623478 isoform X1 [Hydractinia symbiolongicarpus]|uniref:uncharacterized protein LOC130623478 isoform X1 n=1 Tax=Hydractinia symbiolongicarpus TaxID=13093 RepID=UPI00255079E3|nr:uncharacterized protein LOC130623478 isoform X1 [Hydractinia symbiolongicarpus]
MDLLPKLVFSSSEDENEESQLKRTVHQAVGASFDVNKRIKKNDEAEVKNVDGSQSVSTNSWKRASLNQSDDSIDRKLTFVQIEQQKIVLALEKGDKTSLTNAKNALSQLQQNLSSVSKALSKEKSMIKALRDSQLQDNSQSTDQGELIKTAKRIVFQQKILVKYLKLHKELTQNLDAAWKRYPSQLSKDAQQNFTGTSQNNLTIIKKNEIPRLQAESSCSDKPVKSMYSSSVLVDSQQETGLIANLSGEDDQDKAKVYKTDSLDKNKNASQFVDFKYSIKSNTTQHQEGVNKPSGLSTKYKEDTKIQCKPKFIVAFSQNEFCSLSDVLPSQIWNAKDFGGLNFNTDLLKTLEFDL